MLPLSYSAKMKICSKS